MNNVFLFQRYKYMKKKLNFMLMENHIQIISLLLHFLKGFGNRVNGELGHEKYACFLLCNLISYAKIEFK